MRSFAPGKLRAHLSSRVGACGRRPLESADPGVRRAGPLGGESSGELGLGKHYGGRGRGRPGGSHMPTWLPRIVLSLQRELDFRFGGSSGTAPVPGRVSGRPPELPRRVWGSSGRCVGDDFRPKIGPGSSNSEEKSIPRVDFGSKTGLSEWNSSQERGWRVERRREHLFGSEKRTRSRTN